MRKGTTESGFTFEVDEEELNDMEFVELLADAQEDSLMFPRLIERMLGKDQKKALYDHIRNKKGRVPVDATIDIVTEILTLAGEDTKNS